MQNTVSSSVSDGLIQTPEALINYPPYHHQKGLVSSTLGLRFKLSNHHFRGGSMRVKCVASIAPILYRSDRESVVQTQSLPIKDMREALLLAEALWKLEKVETYALVISAEGVMTTRFAKNIAALGCLII
ncbi:hypothetical protein NQ318_005471 [Aromia moschata]|uniref:Uncharacterized protein n=1 Tax=Aromia moschata TaxID=1265417 RepID=A0AAV8XGE8_9CUCU|nr:hypothetical protein NQ318_005471 [Aromia moschata]